VKGAPIKYLINIRKTLLAQYKYNKSCDTKRKLSEVTFTNLK
jgi:hypothetical protein